jgi:hypothetical protein
MLIKKIGLKHIIYMLCFLITCFCARINLPFFYQKDTPESFGFFSDFNSSSRGLKYDKCDIESIDNSLSNSVDFYLGFASSQLVRFEKPDPNYILMFYGNCGHVKEFRYK